MKYINFNSVSIQNFLSVGNTPVVVSFSKGLHIITGVNKDKEDRRNAVGKTTILDAINFAIYGNTVRDLKKDLIVNNITNGICEVKLDFTIVNNGVGKNYVIIRKINPSELALYCDDENVTMHTMAGTNTMIADLISCNQEVFQNCIIMSANASTPFMAKKMVEKRKFIEGIFNLEVFSDMLSKVRTSYNENKKICDIDSAKHETVVTALNNYKHQRQGVLNQRKSSKIDKERQLNENIEKIEKLKNADKSDGGDIDIEGRQKKIEDFNSNIDKLDKELHNLTVSTTTIQTEIGTLTTKLSKIGTKNDLCEVCLKPVDVNDRAHINSAKETIKNDITALNDKLNEQKKLITTYKGAKDKIKEKITVLNNEISQISKKMESKKSLSSAIKSLEDWNLTINKELTTLNSETTDFDELINTTTDKVAQSEIKLAELKSTLNMLDAVKYIVSEEGVKAFIIKRILELFNNRIAYYLKKMDSNCTCIFDEFFDEKFTNEKGKACSYFNFSGAERKAIDLACLFTFMDVRRLQGGVAINISIYDELLDSSVDERGIELVLNILKERVDEHNESVMVISHRKESGKFATGEVICLEKKNGITTRVEYTE